MNETEGLGTEATRSNIIEAIKSQGYIEVKKNIVSVTEKGQILCRAIEGSLLSSPSMTAKWETYLKKIGNVEDSSQHFIANISKFIKQLIVDVPKRFESKEMDEFLGQAAARATAEEEEEEEEIAPCPLYKDGAIIKRKDFYGCSGYKNACKMSIQETIAKKRLTANQVKLLCTKGKTKLIKGFTFSKDKKLVKFDFNKT